MLHYQCSFQKEAYKFSSKFLHNPCSFAFIWRPQLSNNDNNMRDGPGDCGVKLQQRSYLFLLHHAVHKSEHKYFVIEFSLHNYSELQSTFSLPIKKCSGTSVDSLSTKLKHNVSIQIGQYFISPTNPWTTLLIEFHDHGTWYSLKLHNKHQILFRPNEILSLFSHQICCHNAGLAVEFGVSTKQINNSLN